MNKRQIERALDEIARKEIQDDMDLWPNIQNRLNAKPNRWLHPLNSMARYAAVIALALASVVAYAFYQQTGSYDPGLDGVRESDLITELGLAQTQGDLTVTLDWAYADAHRVALSYSSSYVGDQMLQDVSRRLTDQNGNEIPPAFGGGGGGGGGNDGEPRLAEALANYDISGIDLTGRDAIDLRLEITYGTVVVPNGVPDGGVGGGSGGGGGGGGDGTPSVDMPAFMEPIDPVTFTFDFSLPVIQALTVELMETQETNDVEVTLEWMAFAPSLTRAHICHNLITDDEKIWMPQSNLIIPTETEPIVLTATRMHPDTKQSNCFILEYLAPFTGSTESLVLTIEQLQTQIQNYDSAAIVLALQEAGVDAKLMEGGGFSVLNDPESDLDINAIIQEAEDTMRETLEGPWIFEVELP